MSRFLIAQGFLCPILWFYHQILGKPQNHPKITIKKHGSNRADIRAFFFLGTFAPIFSHDPKTTIKTQCFFWSITTEKRTCTIFFAILYKNLVSVKHTLTKSIKNIFFFTLQHHIKNIFLYMQQHRKI